MLVIPDSYPIWKPPNKLTYPSLIFWAYYSSLNDQHQVELIPKDQNMAIQQVMSSLLHHQNNSQ